LLALLGAYHILHISRIRVKSLLLNIGERWENFVAILGFSKVKTIRIKLNFNRERENKYLLTCDFRNFAPKVFPCFSTAVRQMPGYNSQKLGTACTLPKLIVLFCVLFVCKCVLYYCQRVSTQLQLTNISYYITHITSVCFVWFSEQDNSRTESLHSYYANVYSDWSIRILIVIVLYFWPTAYLSTCLGIR